jgi:hypothetical protein
MNGAVITATADRQGDTLDLVVTITARGGHGELRFRAAFVDDDRGLTLTSIDPNPAAPSARD